MKRRIETILIAVLAVVAAVLLGTAINQLWRNAQIASAASPPTLSLKSTEFGIRHVGSVTDTFSIDIFSGTFPTGTLAFQLAEITAPGNVMVVKTTSIVSMPIGFKGYGWIYSNEPFVIEYYAHTPAPQSAKVHNLTDNAGFFEVRYMLAGVLVKKDGPFSISPDQTFALANVSPPAGSPTDDILIVSSVLMEVYQSKPVPLIVK